MKHYCGIIDFQFTDPKGHLKSELWLVTLHVGCVMTLSNRWGNSWQK